MVQGLKSAHVGMVLGIGVVIGTAAHVHAVDLAVFDAAQFDLNGFTFDEFAQPGAVDTSGGYLSLNITDTDATNGAFGGAGSDIIPNVAFDIVDTQFEVVIQVGAGNLASAFRVALVDEDGPFNGEEFFYEFDISSLTPVDGFVTLTSPMLTPLFSQTAFGKGPGDGIQNYGLTQMQVQTVFGAPEALVVDIESVKIVDPNDPTIIRFDGPSYDAAPQSFTFGSMSAAGAVDTTSGNIVIDAQLQAGGDFPGSSFGGVGFSLPAPLDFDATEAEIVFNAKLLANNDSPAIRLQLSDQDPDGAGDDFVFIVDTADLNTTDFTEIVIPLGSGTEDEALTTFGLLPGDMLQNFGLLGMQIQSEGDSATSRLNVEVESFVIREASAGIPGDLDGDGFVGLSDLDIILGDWNENVPPGDDRADVSGPGGVPDGFIGLDDLDEVLGNWNAGTPPTVAVPEPATIALLSLGGMAMLRRRG